MHWLRNLPISRKFFYAFGLVCGLCIVLGIYTSITLRSISEKNAMVSTSDLPSIITLATVRETMRTIRREDLHLLLCTTPSCFTEERVKRQAAVDSFLFGCKVL